MFVSFNKLEIYEAYKDILPLYLYEQILIKFYKLSLYNFHMEHEEYIRQH